MKNDITYEYRVFTNRLIDVESMEVGICTSKVINELKSKDKVDGRFFHTSDTDEWFFCWNGELQKLNLKGDSDVSAALEEVEKLISDAKVAVEDAKKTAGEAKDAADAAKVAADSATAAVETIENKADKSEVEVLTAKVDSKADSSDVDELSKKVDAIKIPSLDGYATEAFVSDKVSEIKVPTKVSELENDKNYLTSDAADLKYAPIGSEGVDLGDYATKEFVGDEIAKIEVPTKVSELENDKNYLTEHQDLSNYAKQEWVEQQGYLTEHQDISGKQDVISDIDAIRSGAKLGETALQSVPEEYITETELNDKGYLTDQSLNGYATETFVNEKIAEIKVPTKVSELENDENYLTEHQDISGKQDVISDIDAIRSGAALGSTALQEVPSEYVTNDELTEKGYATETFVNEKIAEIVIPEVPSMDNYYTKSEIDTMIGDINALIGEATNITNTILA